MNQSLHCSCCSSINCQVFRECKISSWKRYLLQE